MSLLSELGDHILSNNLLQDAGIHAVSMASLDESGRLSTHVVPAGRTPGNADTLFQAGSISKAITALGVARLVDQGLVDLESTVSDYLPASIIQLLGLTDPCVDAVTIESLLSHRSGLSLSAAPGYAGRSDELPTYEQVFNGRPPSTNPRIRFQKFPFSQLSYSGGGYLLLQVILEHIMNQPFPKLMEATVFRPLKMSRSSFEDISDQEDNFARAWETAYQPTSAGYYHFPEKAAAGLWSTPTDLLKAVVAIQHSLCDSNDRGFISYQIARKLITRVFPNQETLSMAMGWAVDENFFCHRGENQPGYHAFLIGTHGGLINSSRFRAGGLAVMIDSADGLDTLRRIVAAYFFLNHWPFVDRLPSNFGSMADLVPFAARVEMPEYPWKRWTGEYEGGWIIALDQDNSPTLSFARNGSSSTVRLLLGALPSVQIGGKEEHTFVTERYNIALRFSQQNAIGSLRIILSDGTTLEVTPVRPEREVLKKF